jgi:type I restriction enzyme R subunit
VPFTDPELEKLQYYGKYLLAKLPRTDDEHGAVNVSDSVVLTHLRTDLLASGENISLTEGSDEPLPGFTGEGRGKEVEIPKAALSSLIDTLNERFGMNLGDADRIWFEQQEEHLHGDPTLRAVASNNDLDQFKVWLGPVLEEKMVERQEANGELFGAFFGQDEFRGLMEGWLAFQLWNRIRGEGEAG